MSKRLILALVAVAAIALVVAPAFAAVQNVKVSGDLEAMPLVRNNFNLQGDSSSAYQRESAILSFLRLRVDADLTDNVSVTTRLLNERAWGESATSANSVNSTEVDLDLAYATLKEFLYSPLTLTIGRQELHMGSELIVGDPDTNNAVAQVDTAARGIVAQPDLSKRKSFDAIRATLDYSPLIIDAIYAKIKENGQNIKDDETLTGLDANYAMKDKWGSMLEGYIYNREKQKTSAAVATWGNRKENTSVVGARVVTKPIKSLVFSAEGAYQFGDYIDTTNKTKNKRKAAAAETFATYNWEKARYTPSLTGAYSYFSGESADFNGLSADSYHGWDPMYENQMPNGAGYIANALLPQTNVHVVGLAAGAKPWEDIGAKVAYNAIWWAKPYARASQTVSLSHGGSVNVNNQRFVGQEIDAMLTYDYTEDVQFGLTGGMFLPGATFIKDDQKAATEVLGSMLVKF